MYMRLPLVILAILGTTSSTFAQEPKTPRRPNVIIIITDDQGHGDLGFHGNPVIKTPNLDKLARSSVRMKNFYVSPVCSPTRASLMTGRYNYRTGVVDTFQGRSMMHADEATLAKLLRLVGYVTGIFGKWHLGDNYPLRAMDQGFMESLVLKGGGIGQPSDPPGGESYFNPVLQHNGKAVKKEGYISDVITDAAINFVTKNKAGPFFCYLAFNCPHAPLEVPQKYHNMYKGKIDPSQFPKAGFPIQGKVNPDETAKIYGMITNIDDNIGRLLKALDDLGIVEDTIVIFLTDNGPQQPRYNSGMRGRKGTVFEGGTRVPFFVRWPAGFPGNRDIDRIAAHIDIAPTVVEACGGKMPKDRVIDGKSLLPLWKGEKIDWPDRALFFQWHRGDVPQLYRAFAVRTQRWRLVQPDGVAEQSKFDKTKWLLFDIERDPFELKDVAADHTDVVASMKKSYETWFADVRNTREFQPPRILVGSKMESPTILTRQDMRQGKFWLLQAEKTANFDIEVTLPMPAAKNTTVELSVGAKRYLSKVQPGDTSVMVRSIEVSAGPFRLDVAAHDGDSPRNVRFVEIRKGK